MSVPTSLPPFSLPPISAPIPLPITLPPFTPPPIAPVAGPDCSEALNGAVACGILNECNPDGSDCDVCFAEGVALFFCSLGFEECTDPFVDYYKCAESAGCELPDEDSSDLGIESCPQCQTSGLLVASCFDVGVGADDCAGQSEAFAVCTTTNECLVDFDNLDPSACPDCLAEIADISACFAGFEECTAEYTELLECAAENNCGDLEEGGCLECLAQTAPFYICITDEEGLSECDASPISLYNCYKENEATCATCLPALELFLASDEAPSCEVAASTLEGCGGCAPCSAEEDLAIGCLCDSAPITSPDFAPTSVDFAPAPIIPAPVASAPVDLGVSAECLASGLALITCYTSNLGDCSACQAEFGIFLAEERLPTCQEAQDALTACGGGCSKCTTEEEAAVPCVCGDEEGAQPAIPEPLAPVTSSPVTPEPTSSPVTPEPTSAPVTDAPVETTAPAPTSATSVQTLSFGLVVLAVAVTAFL